MKICIISDTHGNHNEVVFKEPADVIIHCGDFSSNGSEYETLGFLKWFSSLEQFKHKIFICGNHDFLFYQYPIISKDITPNNLIYLENSDVMIDGVKFFGTPNSNIHGWAFHKDDDGLSRIHKHIPNDVDILISHTPPFGILDTVPRREKIFGSISLGDVVMGRIKPKLHCFGHIHSSYGTTTHNETTFINAALCDEINLITKEPIYITI